MADQNDKAIAAFLAHKASIEEALKRLTDHMEEHAGVSPDDLHWGHVGDLARMDELLTKISHLTEED